MIVDEPYDAVASPPPPFFSNLSKEEKKKTKGCESFLRETIYLIYDIL